MPRQDVTDDPVPPMNQFLETLANHIVNRLSIAATVTAEFKSGAWPVSVHGPSLLALKPWFLFGILVTNPARHGQR
ncbi:uncharacterized protein APUU_31397A [Aspergillus puulaauensis]|uniref:Uncharacterized protein n=1 Tax=Aspergillus puulaauensis TaxID=1220207 RepID=A0A7R8ALX9_9EURO|nr:uncharacterized protein APUU_31397A [Aspergillus puulaauensis]BCS23172.1 hypothetical protein APUU_31397A [Aspergillus puulaauensis]